MKCCCVFHSDHTPSLILDTTLNRYKCFGCGRSGDIISFVQDSKGLTFIEAVKFLLKMYCPEISARDLYEKLTPEEEEKQHERETMFIYNNHAQEFFRAQYEGHNEEAIRCRLYAEKDESHPKGRWDSAFCRTMGLGYSPLKGNLFLAYAQEKGLNLKILLKMGLIR